MANGKKEFKLWLDWRVHKRFKAYAAKNGHSMSWYLKGYISGLIDGKRGEGHRAKAKKKSPTSG